MEKYDYKLYIEIISIKLKASTYYQREICLCKKEKSYAGEAQWKKILVGPSPSFMLEDKLMAFYLVQTTDDITYKLPSITTALAPTLIWIFTPNQN